MFFGESMLAGMSSQLGMIYNKATNAQSENLQLLADTYNRWCNIGVSRLTWRGLPSSVDERLLNMGLFLNGIVAFFNHDVLGLIALPCDPGNRFNLLYQPTQVTAYGHGASFVLSNERAVEDNGMYSSENDGFEVVRFTPTGIPVAITVFNLVKRMTDIMRSIDVVAQRMKRPYVFICDEKERLTYQNLFKKVKDNEELILGQKNFALNESHIDVAPTPSTGDLNALWNSYKNYETMLYTVMGIDNSGYEKKERLVVDEVNANNMVIDMSDEVNLKEMKLGLQRVNARFGTNIDVEITRQMIKDDMDVEPEGGDQHGNLYYYRG